MRHEYLSLTNQQLKLNLNLEDFIQYKSLKEFYARKYNNINNNELILADLYQSHDKYYFILWLNINLSISYTLFINIFKDMLLDKTSFKINSQFILDIVIYNSYHDYKLIKRIFYNNYSCNWLKRYYYKILLLLSNDINHNIVLIKLLIRQLIQNNVRYLQMSEFHHSGMCKIIFNILKQLYKINPNRHMLYIQQQYINFLQMHANIYNKITVKRQYGIHTPLLMEPYNILYNLSPELNSFLNCFNYYQGDTSIAFKNISFGEKEKTEYYIK